LNIRVFATPREWTEEDKDIMRKLLDMGYKLTVTGGMTIELLPFFADLPISVLICGRHIRESADPRATAHQMRMALADLWSHSSTSISSSRTPTPISALPELAAQAIRWGVSEMGLSLVVDGRKCPGCDSPHVLSGNANRDPVPRQFALDDSAARLRW
jgi:hypothetical protein